MMLGLAVPGAPAAQVREDFSDFAALEAAGAVIREVRIVPQDIFDTSDPREDHALFRLANRLHIRTRPEVIRRALLFQPGEAVSVRRIQETERRLRANRYLYDVQFRALAVNEREVDVEVVTRDTWSLDFGLSASRSGGASSGGFGLREYNLFGTGSTLAIGRQRDVDRTTNLFAFANDRVLGSRIGVAYSHATNSDGQRDEAVVGQPFRALDDRRAFGARALRDDRLDSVYRGGLLQSQYRHVERSGDVYAGWSQGLVDGWVQRTSVVLQLQEDRYGLEPGVVAPAALPPDQKLAAPFVRVEWLEDRFERDFNRNLIGRPEFFALGLVASAQLGWSTPVLGASRRAALYEFALSRGFEPGEDDRLILVAKVAGQFEDDRIRRGSVGVLGQYYRPQSPRRLFYASAALDTLQRPDPGTELLLGGDNGLRGYPLRYQSGQHRALFTVEQRFYTDVFVWQLFRLGGAGFLDAGRAWGGPAGAETTSGWLANAGAGLRIVSARSAFANVLHIDLAFPLNAAGDIRTVQLNVRTKTSF